jgi:hypothetical protein
MRQRPSKLVVSSFAVLGSLGLACSDSSTSTLGTGGSSSGSSSGGTAGSVSSGGTGGGSTAGGSGGGAGQGGSTNTTGGAGGTAPSGGTSAAGGATGGGGLGGDTQTGGTTRTGGATASGGRTGIGGRTGTGTGGATGGTTSTGTSPDGGTIGGGCVPTKTWGTVDPSVKGPFEVVVENNIGPENGNPDAKWNNQKPHFNLYYPKDMTQGYCHPIITWGNGTGDQPPTYEVLIKQLASHGFVVVASLSSQTAQGTPLPQVAGVDWMFKENADPASKFYHKLDTSKVGATGHSQGGMATSMSGADSRIVATVPICGARAGTLHGPSLLICGGADDMVKCSSVQTAFDGITGVAVMMAELAGVTHGSWIGSIKDPVMVGTTGWMRVHLMNDTANRGMFYGASCKVCSDSKWKVQRKMMDQ